MSVTRRSKKNRISKPIVAIVMGSKSDLKDMSATKEVFDQFGITYKFFIKSAHRTPKEVSKFATEAEASGFKVIIAGAGGAAHLPGMIAAETVLPVIGVPVASTLLKGLDSLFSIVQMPKGIPVATVSISNSWNAALLAVQMLSIENQELKLMLHQYKMKMRKKVLKEKI